MYTKVSAQYWWPRLYKTVKKYTRECLECQKYLLKREEEALYLTQIATFQERVLINIIYILTAKLGKQYLVVAKEYFLGWLEAKALINIIFKAVAKFLQKEIIYRQGVFKQLFINRGPENKNIVVTLIGTYGIY